MVGSCKHVSTIEKGDGIRGTPKHQLSQPPKKDVKKCATGMIVRWCVPLNQTSRWVPDFGVGGALGVAGPMGGSGGARSEWGTISAWENSDRAPGYNIYPLVI